MYCKDKRNAQNTMLQPDMLFFAINWKVYDLRAEMLVILIIIPIFEVLCGTALFESADGNNSS